MSDSEHGRLGDLELEVLNILWQADEPLEVRDVSRRLEVERAHTTVMTTLSRLWKKGYVEQHRHGRAYAYTAKVSQANVTRKLLSRLVDSLSAGDPYALIPHLLGREEPLTKRERERLNALAASIRDPDESA